MKDDNKTNINPWIIAIAVMFPTALEILDSTVANVALPYISGGLAASVDESTWVLTSYIISNAVMLPITYWFSDKLGKKNFLLVSITVFTFSSMMCGFSTSLGELILFRIMQGLGGGGLMPLSQSILLDVFPKEKHGQAMGFYGFGLLLAPIIGPYVGGWLSDNYNWNLIFFINIPIGIIAFITIKTIIPDFYNNNKKKRIHLDYTGLFLLILFIAPFQIVLDKGQENDWFASKLIIILTIVSVLSFFILMSWLKHAKNPLIKLNVFKDKNYAISVLLLFIRAFSFYGVGVAIPLFVENLMGYTATIAGEVSIFSGLAVMIAMPIVGNLTSKYNPKYLLIIGVSLTSFALFSFVGVTLQVNFEHIAFYRAIFGVGSAFIMIPLNTIAFSSLESKLTTQGTGVLALARSLGSSIGISVVSTLIVRRSQIHQNYLTYNTNNFNHAFLNYLKSAQHQLHSVSRSSYQLVYNMVQTQAKYQAYTDVFQVLLLFMLIFIPFIFFIKRSSKKLEITT